MIAEWYIYKVVSVFSIIAVMHIMGNYNFWRIPKNKFFPRMLMYHSIESKNLFPPDLPASLNIDPKTFEKQIKYLIKKGYVFLKASELLTFTENKPHVVLTFDDGFYNNYKNAFPILKKYNAKATIFLCPEDSELKSVFKTLSEKEIKEMQDSGLVEFGAHTYTHKNLTRLKDSDAEKEIKLSKDYVEKVTNKKCDSFAYPYGRYNDKHVEMLKKYGFKLGFSIKKRIFPKQKLNPYKLPRLGIIGKMNMIQFHIMVTRGKFRL